MFDYTYLNDDEFYSYRKNENISFWNRDTDIVSGCDINEVVYIEERINAKYTPILPPNLPKITIEDKLTYDFYKDVKFFEYGNDCTVKLYSEHDFTELFTLDIEIIKKVLTFISGTWSMNSEISFNV